MKKKRAIALVLTGLIGGSLVLGGAVFASTTSGQANGDCRMGYYTSDDAVVGAYTSVADIAMTKTCEGPVEGRFTAEITRSAAGTAQTFTYLAATCTATGGLTNPCTPGQVFYATPSGTYLSNCIVSATEACPSGSTGTRGMNGVFSSLKRGVWNFQVFAAQTGGDGFIDRAFTVSAFNA